MKGMTTRQLSLMALLTAIALAIHVAEAQIPAPVPIPGVKLGLANIITVYAVFTLGAGPACMILAARILLGSLFAGQAISLLYSLRAHRFLDRLRVLNRADPAERIKQKQSDRYARNRELFPGAAALRYCGGPLYRLCGAGADCEDG